ncbi:MAG: hypothetical protein E7226_03225 [Clostridiales bacterium]|nr:hypothetical protein [Clostridiales bacterium]
MDNFDKLNRIRNRFDRKSETLTNASEVTGESGFRCLHILWLYPDVLNIHGGRGDVMALLHMCDLLNIPVEIRRSDNLKADEDWNWPHIVYMTAGELKCADKVSDALIRQKEEIRKFIRRGGFLIANGSSGAVLGKRIEYLDGRVIEGTGFLDMTWKERESVWGDDIWVRTEDGLDVIGNQIQVADVTLGKGQKPFGSVIYGRGNNGTGDEGAVDGSVIYTGVLGPLLTKNPRLTAGIIESAAVLAQVELEHDLNPADIEIEDKSAEYIKAFMKAKMESQKTPE